MAEELFRFFKNMEMAMGFRRIAKFCLDKLRLKINLRMGIKMSEQPFIIKPGTS